MNHIKLSDFSYLDNKDYSLEETYRATLNRLRDIGEYEIVWGPVFSGKTSNSANLLYIVKEKDTYLVIIRGTNFKSLFDLFMESSRLKLVSFSDFDKDCPTNAKISKGLATALDIILSLKDKIILREFLKGKKTKFIGHSLGGSLAMLMAVIYKSSAFAWGAFTPGNDILAEYAKDLDITRIVNKLDIVTHFFDDMSILKSIYFPEMPNRVFSIGLNFLDKVSYGNYFFFGKEVLIESKLQGLSYLEEASYQHTNAYF